MSIGESVSSKTPLPRAPGARPRGDRHVARAAELHHVHERLVALVEQFHASEQSCSSMRSCSSSTRATVIRHIAGQPWPMRSHRSRFSRASASASTSPPASSSISTLAVQTQKAAIESPISFASVRAKRESPAPLDVSAGRLDSPQNADHTARACGDGVVAQLALHAGDRCVQRVRTPAERAAQPGERVRCLCVVAALRAAAANAECLPLLSELITGVVVVGDCGPRLCEAEVVAGRLEHRYRFLRGRKTASGPARGRTALCRGARIPASAGHPARTRSAQPPRTGSTWSTGGRRRAWHSAAGGVLGARGHFWVSGRRLAERGSRRPARRLAPEPAAQPHRAVPRRACPPARGH